MLINSTLTANILINKTKVLNETLAYEAQLKSKSKTGRLSIHFVALEIEKQAAKSDVIMDILVEVNIANEETKFGISKTETVSLIKEIAKLPHVRIKGLMTIAPYVENPEENRCFFRQIKELAVDINNQNIDNVDMDILSMGMTGDYMVAIEEGATIIRVGTGIFGERIYN